MDRSCAGRTTSRCGLREGANPVDTDSRNDYFDSLYHSVAAVGINTSAQIEAGIVGRPVYSIRAAEYVTTQEGTLHFHYLLNENGGLLHMSPTLEEHARALSTALDRTPEDERRLREFVKGFVRPRGLDVAATPLLADAIEELGRLPARARERVSLGSRLLRMVLYPGRGEDEDGAAAVARSVRSAASRQDSRWRLR